MCEYTAAFHWTFFLFFFLLYSIFLWMDSCVVGQIYFCLYWQLFTVWITLVATVFMAEFIASPVTLAFRAMNKLVSLPVFLLGFPSSHLLLYAADIAVPVKPISEWQATSSEATYWFLAVEFVHNLLWGNYLSTSPLLTLPSYHRYLMFVVKVLLYASCVIYYLLFVVFVSFI